MRRTFGIGVLLLVILAGVAIGVGAYHAGVNHGLQEAAHGARVVHVVGPGFGYGFPFGLILFPLLLFAIFAVARGAFWRRRWNGGPGHGKGPAMFDEWHRRPHEVGTGDPPGTGGEPATA